MFDPQLARRGQGGVFESQSPQFVEMENPFQYWKCQRAVEGAPLPQARSAAAIDLEVLPSVDPSVRREGPLKGPGAGARHRRGREASWSRCSRRPHALEERHSTSAFCNQTPSI